MLRETSSLKLLLEFVVVDVIVVLSTDEYHQVVVAI